MRLPAEIDDFHKKCVFCSFVMFLIEMVSFIDFLSFRGRAGIHGFGLRFGPRIPYRKFATFQSKIQEFMIFA